MFWKTHFSTKILAFSLLAGLFLFADSLEAGAQSRPSVLEDPVFRRDAQRGLDLLYNMEFDRANAIFEQIDRRNPDHPVGPFLKALNTWWVILLDLFDESHDDQFLDEMQEVIRRSDRILRRDRNNLDATFFKGAALGLRGRLRANRRQWLRAARDGRSAMSYVLDVADADPDNPDFYFGRGIYNYYAAVIPQNYTWVRPFMLFFPSGDREKGLEELKHVYRHGHFIQTEAAYFLLQIYHVLENNRAQSLEYVNWLRRRHPNNPFFHTFEGRVYARWGNWNRSGDIYREILQRHEEGYTGYNLAIAEQALYYLGRTEMVYGDYQAALRYFDRLDGIAERRPEDTFFAVLGTLRQGMSHDALGQRREAERHYREVLSRRDWADSRQTARRYLREPFVGIRTSSSSQRNVQ